MAGVQEGRHCSGRGIRAALLGFVLREFYSQPKAAKALTMLEGVRFQRGRHPNKRGTLVSFCSGSASVSAGGWLWKRWSRAICFSFLSGSLAGKEEGIGISRTAAPNVAFIKILA